MLDATTVIHHVQHTCREPLEEDWSHCTEGYHVERGSLKSLTIITSFNVVKPVSDRQLLDLDWPLLSVLGPVYLDPHELPAASAPDHHHTLKW